MKNKIIFFIVLSVGFFANAKSLNLQKAKSIAEKVAACGLKNKWNLSVAVVNSEGNLIYFQRGDDSYVGSIEASIEKARSANAFKRPTSAFVDSLKEGRTGLLSLKGIVAIEGGRPIVVGDQHIGGLGVSGARAIEDDQCAVEALK